MKKKIKILHIISSLHQGGAERQLLELTKNNNNHAVCHLIPGGIYEREFKKNKILLFSLNVNKNILIFKAIYDFFKIVRLYKPDIIQTWMYHSSLLGTFFKIIIFSRSIPLIWGLRCSNMDTSKYSLVLRIVIKFCRYFSSNPDIIINNSNAGLEFHKNIGFKNSNNIVIHNGIDINIFKSNSIVRNKFRAKFKINTDVRVLLCVGRYDPMKDHDTLLKAFQKIRLEYKSCILILAGEGTKNISHIEGVISLGVCEKIYDIYSASDIIISSSAFGEGFSNAIAEGMATNLIPIGTKVGETEYIMGNVGISIEPSNTLKLYNAIKKLIELDNDSFLKKKILARKRIVDKFSINKMNKNYNNIYNQLLKEK